MHQKLDNTNEAIGVQHVLSDRESVGGPSENAVLGKMSLHLLPFASRKHRSCRIETGLMKF